MSRGGRVLVVDDDVDILEVCSLILERAGYEVVTAANGSEALERLQEPEGGDIALIVLDLMMPVMDGWEFRDRQLADPTLRDIPVVVSSGDHRAIETLPRGVAGVLTKPVSLDVLLSTVERHTA